MLLQSKNISLKIKKSQKPIWGVVVSKSVEKSAVKRNLLKRRVKSIITGFVKNTKKEEKDNSIIFYLKKGVKNQKYKDLKSETIDILKRAGF